MIEDNQDIKMINAKPDHIVEIKTVDIFSKKLEKAKLELEKTDKKIILRNEDTGEQKTYTPVAVRVDIFRKHFGFSGRLISKIKEKNDQEIIVEATLDILMDGKFVRIANAHANKTRYQSSITQFGNMIETAETSAIGRVLANIGLSGGEFASLEDLVGYKKMNNDGLEISNISIQETQIKEINLLLKEKNYKINELLPEINDVSELNYEEANNLIEELTKKRKKRTSIRNKTSENNTSQENNNDKEDNEDNENGMF